MKQMIKYYGSKKEKKEEDCKEKSNQEKGCKEEDCKEKSNQEKGCKEEDCKEKSNQEKGCKEEDYKEKKEINLAPSFALAKSEFRPERCWDSLLLKNFRYTSEVFLFLC